LRRKAEKARRKIVRQEEGTPTGHRIEHFGPIWGPHAPKFTGIKCPGEGVPGEMGKGSSAVRGTGKKALRKADKVSMERTPGFP